MGALWSAVFSLAIISASAQPASDASKLLQEADRLAWLRAWGAAERFYAQAETLQIHHLRQDEARSAALRLVMSHPGKYPASDEEQKYRDGKRHNDD
jgi:hypothetical protein